MCKPKPAVNNGGQDVSSSNMAIGLVNFSNEEFSLSKPHHRTEIIAILIFIMILAFGLYKLRQRCLKKRNNNLPQARLSSLKKLTREKGEIREINSNLYWIL